MTTYTYLAEFSDAEDVKGTIEHELDTAVLDMLDPIAEDIRRKTGQLPIDYGQLVGVLVTWVEDGQDMEFTYTPQYGDE